MQKETHQGDSVLPHDSPHLTSLHVVHAHNPNVAWTEMSSLRRTRFTMWSKHPLQAIQYQQVWKYLFSGMEYSDGLRWISGREGNKQFNMGEHE
jgi:hypothetical protein